jgi:FAD/FMN-containing dehydrogenase/Fe-S oxidoreductase
MSWDELAGKLQGQVFFDDSAAHLAVRKVYATDASMYQELPMAVVVPRTEEDIRATIGFAAANGLTLIPRAAGTSLAGQVVGSGVVVDISRHFSRVLEVNKAEKWVRVQPGVIRDDLNAYLKPYGLMYGPETSTSSRAMIGGMIGNNSCGLHSLIWGAARDNLLELKVLLSDGSESVISPLSLQQAAAKSVQDNLEGRIYKCLLTLLTDEDNQQAIQDHFPEPAVKRRNAGYALDALLDGMKAPEGRLDLCKLIAGSEGTLCFVTEARLKLIDLPPPEVVMVAIHCGTLKEALLANLIALRHGCAASELVDDYIIGFAAGNPGFSSKAAFVQGKPKAILMVEFFTGTGAEARGKAEELITDLKKNNVGYACPVLHNAETLLAWDLRKAGLGLIRNLPGDAQPVNLIEDCAVSADKLPAYMEELGQLLDRHRLSYCVYAHAGPGELHVEPIINLKTNAGKAQLRAVLTETAAIVKKFRGALSGEHGDGRLRGEFIPFMMGEKVYELFRQVKAAFDPNNVFNRNKITETLPMDSFLRFAQEETPPVLETYFDFSGQESALRLAEKCSGSGDCRKSHITGGTMCPSFMATRSERDTTRARANILRQFISGNRAWSGKGEDEVKDILDLCLSCKGCKTECPSGVDITRLKAEFTQHYYDNHTVPARARLVARFEGQMNLARKFAWLYNGLFANQHIRRTLNRMVGFHPERSIPPVAWRTLRKRLANMKEGVSDKPVQGKKNLYLFCDEFTNYLDAEAGEKAARLMVRLGYHVIVTGHPGSARGFLSKGFVRETAAIAEKQVAFFGGRVNAETPLVGIEPSAILGFRDEFISLVPPEQRSVAKQLAKQVFTFEEWFCREVEAGNILPDAFTRERRKIVLHEHCHQKALSKPGLAKKALSLPVNYEVNQIPSGCCGMAGSFGYEAEHYRVSMQIGSLVLFPALKTIEPGTWIAAAGTSCRHQIKDGTGLEAKHPAEILYEALG